MRTPLEPPYMLETLAQVESTQDRAGEVLRSGAAVGVVHALDQTAGRGRFRREWISEPGDSLTFSLIFRAYADHPRPYLVGMAAAIAAAGAIHCRLQWPNDLVIGERKVGGILSEMLADREGRRVPVVGIGINLNQTSFPPEIADRATSLHLAHGGHYDAATVARQVLGRLELLPEPDDWGALAPIWDLFDQTPGKKFRLANGETAVALGVGPEGQLMCAVDGESQSVLAADAIFGPDGILEGS